MPNLTCKVRVCLTDEQRQELAQVCRSRSMAAGKVRRARVLLMSDEAHPEGRRRDWEIAEALGLSERQVVRVPCGSRAGPPAVCPRRHRRRPGGQAPAAGCAEAGRPG